MIFVLLWTFFFPVCERTVVRPNPAIAFRGLALTVNGRNYCGTIETKIEGPEITRRTRYRDGLPHGREEERFSDGTIAAIREYDRGKKIGTHLSFYRGGQRRSHVEYEDGHFEGESWEWYASGALAGYARYEHGRGVGKKIWRENGEIYLNVVYPAGQPAGLPGSRLCAQVRHESP